MSQHRLQPGLVAQGMHMPIFARTIATSLLILLMPAFIAQSSGFESASGVDETRHQLSILPKNDIWWTLPGKSMAWNHRNLHRIFPTVNVYRDGPVRELSYRLLPELANYPVETPDGPMSYSEFLDSDHAAVLGVVIVHRGAIVFEHYPEMQAYEKPIYWSVSKVLVSTVLGILEDRGLVDVTKPIESYIPEMKNSVFAGVKVRNILDMATGIDCPEEYVDRSSCYYRMMQTIGEGYWDEFSPDNPYQYLASLKAPRHAEQGTVFDYQSINTFVLSWLVEKLTNMPFQDALSREIWTRMGAESDAAFLAPRFGVPVTDGGFLARMRDMARFGMLFTPSYGMVSDARIVSEAHVQLLLHGGNPKLLENARSPGWHDDETRHNIYQWDRVSVDNSIFKGGWSGQGLLINPVLDLVAVYTGYFKDDYSEMAHGPVLRKMLKAVFSATGKPLEPKSELATTVDEKDRNSL